MTRDGWREHKASTFVLLLLGLSSMRSSASGSVADSALPPALKAAPSNTWVKIHEFPESGARAAPAFFYDLSLRKFVLTGGAPGGAYGQSPRHYDTEEFDLASAVWSNAYPSGAGSDYAPVSGATHAPQTLRDDAAREFRRDKAGYLRIPWWYGYGNGSGVYFQFAWDADSRKLLACIQNQTVIYDPVSRAWSQTSAAPFSKGAFMHWGSFCYDPIHHEVVSVGGTSDEAGGTPGTWVYRVSDNRWEKLQLGSEAQNNLRARVDATTRAAATVVGVCRNRFHLTETAAEARASFNERVDRLGNLIDSDRSLLPAPQASAAELAGRQAAAPSLKKARMELEDLKNAIVGPMSAATIAIGQSVCDDLQNGANALAVEPPARALSQMVYDAGSKKIVLFGGDGLDRHYADTWIYDCSMRTWEQRFPKVSPSPRAGHALLFLPRSGKLFLAGGYSLGNGHSYMYGDVYAPLPFESWIYDTTRNEWSPLPTSGAPPVAKTASQFSMAADENDNVVYVAPSGRFGFATWACRVDSGGIDAEKRAQRGVPAQTAAFRGDEDEPHKGYLSAVPAFWDRGPAPDPAAMAAMYDALPSNQWIQKVPAKGVDVRGWGTSAYDPDRDQILYWGGGHSEYKGTDVSHYSLRTGLWSGSTRPEWVLEASSDFLLPVLVSFHNRPHIPVHAYQTYACDPPSGLMVAVKDAPGAKHSVTFVYDPSARDWQPTMFEAPFGGGVMHVIVRATPGGAVAWAEEGLFRFDSVGRTWQRLPVDGDKLAGPPWCDGSAMIYDSSRDCLWLSLSKDLSRYDLKTGRLEAVHPPLPAILGENPFWREAVFLPQDDLILLAKLFKDPQGRFTNVAYDAKANKWVRIQLPFISEADAKPQEFKENPFSWSSAIFYDASRKLVVLHAPVNFWFLHFDRNKAAIVPLEMQ